MKDLYTVAANPQYSLDISGENSGAVWLLLTRHITDIEDFRENKEYITIFVYKGGKKVYYPCKNPHFRGFMKCVIYVIIIILDDPPPYIDGIKINSPHYTTKIILGPGSSRKYTIVISQYQKSTTIHYTLRAYATCPFTLTKIRNPYTQEQQVTGEWKGVTAGGCPNHPASYPNNPKFKIDIDSISNNNQLLIELRGPKVYQMGIETIIQKVNDETVTAPFKSKSSGPYR